MKIRIVKSDRICHIPGYYSLLFTKMMVSISENDPHMAIYISLHILLLNFIFLCNKLRGLINLFRNEETVVDLFCDGEVVNFMMHLIAIISWE
ncbi:unnamed protein product [Rhizophagus irregularis]|nr:unnamed protein product [Rhizophagus irregularis]CAB5394662.1 unnamed protein product [Rhizophagus irregularis]